VILPATFAGSPCHMNQLYQDFMALVRKFEKPYLFKVVQGEQTGVYSTEFLNSLSMSRVPPHTLTLQEGCLVILLWNMPGGLANGTRLIVVKLV